MWLVTVAAVTHLTAMWACPCCDEYTSFTSVPLSQQQQMREELELLTARPADSSRDHHGLHTRQAAATEALRIIERLSRNTIHPEDIDDRH